MHATAADQILVGENCDLTSALHRPVEIAAVFCLSQHRFSDRLRDRSRRKLPVSYYDRDRQKTIQWTSHSLADTSNLLFELRTKTRSRSNTYGVFQHDLIIRDHTEHHSYRVRVCDNQGNPRIVDLIDEIGEPSDNDEV